MNVEEVEREGSGLKGGRSNLDYAVCGCWCGVLLRVSAFRNNFILNPAYVLRFVGQHTFNAHGSTTKINSTQFHGSHHTRDQPQHKPQL